MKPSRVVHCILQHEAALSVMVEAAEQQEGQDPPGDILCHAIPLTFYATKVLRIMVPQATQNARALACKAVRLQGYILGAVPPQTLLPSQLERRQLRQQQQSQPQQWDDPEGPLLEDGVSSMLASMSSFPSCSSLACEVCTAVVRITAHSPKQETQQVLAAFRASYVVLDVLRGFHEDVEVLRMAVLALAVLGGLARVLELMHAAQENHSVQLAGCQALVEVMRRGYEFQSAQELQATELAVQKATQVFSPHDPACRLQSQAELALGFIGAACNHAASMRAQA